MKTRTTMITTVAPLSALMLLAGTAVGQYDGTQDRDRPVRDSQQAYAQDKSVVFTLAKDIRGTEIYSTQGEEIGSVSDLVVDVRAGKAIYAVVSFGGWLGIDSESVAVPMKAISWDRTNERFVLPVTKERVQNAPKFDSTDWDRLDDRDWCERTRQAFGELPDKDGREGHRDHRRDDTRAAGRNYDRYMLSTKLAAAKISGRDGEDFGAIEDIIVDRSSGDIGFVTLKTGGVLGIGAETRVVPWEALERREDLRFFVALNGSEIENAPKVKSDQIADLRNSDANKDIYAFYNVDPRRDWATGGDRMGQTMFASASSMTDSAIVNRQGETLGEIDDLIIGFDRGTAPYAVVSFGGVVGIGSETVAVPVRSLTWDRSEDRFELPLNRERLQSAPDFDSENLDGIEDEAWRDETRRVFGDVPRMDRTDDRRSNPQDTRDRANRNLDAYVLVSKVRGMEVVGSGDEKLGSIQDVILDRNSGHIGFVTMEVGGTMGIGAELVAVPWEALNRIGESRVRLKTTKADLDNAPRVKSERIGDLNDRQFTQRIYSFYNVEARPMLDRNHRYNWHNDADHRNPDTRR